MVSSIDDVQKILTQLDSGNDEHWTDDGAPSLTAVQQIGNDTSITRDMINRAIPGFSRAGNPGEEGHEDGEVEQAARDFQAKTAAAQGKVVSAPVKGAPVPKDEGDLGHEDSYNLDPKDPLTDVPSLPQSKLREIMWRRVESSKARLDEARAAITAAQAYATKVETFYNQNLAAYQKAFPPMHPSDAIKEHLARTAQHRAEAAGRPDLYRTKANELPASALDARMSIKGERSVRGLMR